MIRGMGCFFKERLYKDIMENALKPGAVKRVEEG
jgi:hypothetical protein